MPLPFSPPNFLPPARRFVPGGALAPKKTRYCPDGNCIEAARRPSPAYTGWPAQWPAGAAPVPGPAGTGYHRSCGQRNRPLGGMIRPQQGQRNKGILFFGHPHRLCRHAVKIPVKAHHKIRHAVLGNGLYHPFPQAGFHLIRGIAMAHKKNRFSFGTKAPSFKKFFIKRAGLGGEPCSIIKENM